MAIDPRAVYVATVALLELGPVNRVLEQVGEVRVQREVVVDDVGRKARKGSRELPRFDDTLLPARTPAIQRSCDQNLSVITPR